MSYDDMINRIILTLMAATLLLVDIALVAMIVSPERFEKVLVEKGGCE